MCADKHMNDDKVDNVNHPIAIQIRSLLQREERKAQKLMIIDDEQNILEALQQQINIVMVLHTEEDAVPESIIQQLDATVPIKTIVKRTAKKLFGGEKMSRLFAIANMPHALSLEALAAKQQDMVVLEKLGIAGNVGAIIRTTAALSKGGMVLLDTDVVDIYDRRVIRSSRGYVFRVPIVCVSTEVFIQFCKAQQIEIMVTLPQAKQTIDEVAKQKEPFAFIFGAEKTGCSKTLIQAADIQARIPMNAGVESLNVSVAASIMLYLRSQQR